MADTADSPSTTKTVLLGLTLAQLREALEPYGLPRYAAAQVASWLYKKRVVDIDSMTDLSKEARRRLDRHFTVGRYEPSGDMRSADGTVKYLFAAGNGREVESVYIPDADRATLCVSSQAGCRMNCGFCMTGRQGFHGNLTSGQIMNQILSIPESDRLTNIVYMGMGEPLDNIGAVLDSIDILTSKWGMEWSPKRITVSSIGKLDNLPLLLDRTKVHVAISVHSPIPAERARLMPVENAYPVKKVMELLAGYDFTRQRRCSVEYIMWKGINDDLAHARELVRLLGAVPGVRVNLIRYHSLPDLPGLEPCDMRQMEAFRDYLNRKGVVATIRSSRGEDIMAACGMLAGKLGCKQINS